MRIINLTFAATLGLGLFPTGASHAACTLDTDQDGTCDDVDTDDDGDGLSDFVELHAFGTDPKVDDTDLDGLTDFDEVYAFATDPNVDDTDGDGLLDGAEVTFYGTLPSAADTDGDGVPDDIEVQVLSTDPTLVDTDDDGVDDGDEDSDGDGLLNRDEVRFDLVVDDADSDDDGVADGLEDADNDGVGLAAELLAGTDPADADSDGDGLDDGDELGDAATDPLDPDSDDDGLGDAEEVAQGDVDPNDADSDDDGVLDGLELRWSEDTDGDDIINALDPDSDGDGVLDGTELGVVVPHDDTTVSLGFFIPDADAGLTTTHMLRRDSDGAGVEDGVEDANQNGRWDDGESDPSDPLDDGAGALIAISPIAVDDPACPNGGRRFDVGFDNGEGEGIAADGVLQADEIDVSEIVCDGVDGLMSLTLSTSLPVEDTNCALGGTRVDTGLDDDRDGLLSAAEIDSTAFVCAAPAEIDGWGGGGCSGGMSHTWVGLLLVSAAWFSRRAPKVSA